MIHPGIPSTGFLEMFIRFLLSHFPEQEAHYFINLLSTWVFWYLKLPLIGALFCSRIYTQLRLVSLPRVLNLAAWHHYFLTTRPPCASVSSAETQGCNGPSPGDCREGQHVCPGGTVAAGP